MTMSLPEVKAEIRRLQQTLARLQAYLVPPEGQFAPGSPVLVRGHIEEVWPNEYKVRIEADRIVSSFVVDRINVLPPVL